MNARKPRSPITKFPVLSRLEHWMQLYHLPGIDGAAGREVSPRVFCSTHSESRDKPKTGRQQLWVLGYDVFLLARQLLSYSRLLFCGC